MDSSFLIPYPILIGSFLIPYPNLLAIKGKLLVDS